MTTEQDCVDLRRVAGRQRLLDLDPGYRDRMNRVVAVVDGEAARANLVARLEDRREVENRRRAADERVELARGERHRDVDEQLDGAGRGGRRRDGDRIGRADAVARHARDDDRPDEAL